MKQRNPEATCATCPYHRVAHCQRHTPKMKDHKAYFPVAAPQEWCGEHPDFFLDEDQGIREEEE